MANITVYMMQSVFSLVMILNLQQEGYRNGVQIDICMYGPLALLAVNG